MKNLKTLIGLIVLMSIFSCEINESPISNEITDQEENVMLSIGEQHAPTEDRKEN